MAGPSVVVAVALTAGCSLLTSLDGFSDGAPAEAGADAAPTSADATAEIGADVAAADAGGSGDARSSPDAQGCAALGTHTFCADFDESGTLTDGWTAFRASPGIGELDTTLAQSPSRSALLRVPAGTSCVFAQLYKTFTGAFTSGSVSFEARVGDVNGAAPSRSQNIVAIEIGHQCMMLAAPWGDAPSMYRQDTPSGASGEYFVVGSSMPVGQWHRVGLTYTIAPPANAPFATLAVDGTVVESLSTLPDACKVTGDVTIIVGFHCAASQPSALDLRADDVFADIH